MTAIGFLVIVAYLLAFFLYNGLYSIKTKLDKQQLFYDKKEKVITSILAVIFIIAFLFDWTNYKMDKAYNYIINHPDEYTDYIAKSFIKDKKKLYKCIDKDDMCKQRYEQMRVYRGLIDEQVNDYYYSFFKYADDYEPHNMQELLILKVITIMDKQREK